MIQKLDVEYTKRSFDSFNLHDKIIYTHSMIVKMDSTPIVIESN